MLYSVKHITVVILLREYGNKCILEPWSEKRNVYALTNCFSSLFIELYILTKALTCSAFWSHPGRRHVWCVARLRNDFDTHWHDFFYIRHVRLRTQLPNRIRPRYENHKFNLIEILKKVYTPIKHEAHDACSLYAHQQIVRSHLLHFFGSMTHKKRTNALSCK